MRRNFRVIDHCDYDSFAMYESGIELTSKINASVIEVSKPTFVAACKHFL